MTQSRPKGNITSVTVDGNTTTYTYDPWNQLIREDNQAGGYTYVWTYDDAGNILSRTRHAYTTGTPGTATETLTYTYGDANWGDLLTKVNNLSITYDTVGNPLNYYNGYSFTWENGRRLSSMAVGMSTWTMGYDNSGMRIRRTDGTTDYRYAYIGGKLTQMAVNNAVLDFTYDANGAPITVTYDGMVYYYVTNLQGDVTAILNQFGVPVVEYTYDAWGNILSTTGSMANTLGELNPLRYRGYVYDSETGFYYLQSRYYDPEIGRFINADALVSTGQGILGNNMFAYCNNNSIIYVDSSGTLPVINDIFNEIKKGVRWTLNNVIDPVVRGTEDLLSNIDLTASPGRTMGGNLFFIGAAIASSVAIDTKGNVGLQMTISLNGNNAFSFSSCYGRSNMITNAPSIYHLEKFSIIGGGSLFFPVGPLAVGGGLDINAIPQSVGDPFWGVSYMRGLAKAPGFEIHAGGSYTFTLFSFNIFDIYDSVYDAINGR